MNKGLIILLFCMISSFTAAVDQHPTGFTSFKPGEDGLSIDCSWR